MNLPKETPFDFQTLPTGEETERFNTPINLAVNDNRRFGDRTQDAPVPEQLCRRCGFLLAAHGRDGCDGFKSEGEQPVRFKINPRAARPVHTLGEIRRRKAAQHGVTE
jgi:hypothetical protein